MADSRAEIAFQNSIHTVSPQSKTLRVETDSIGQMKIPNDDVNKGQSTNDT